MCLYLKAFFFVALSIYVVSPCLAHPLDEKCKKLSEKHVEKMLSSKLRTDSYYLIRRVDAFYSPIFDGCIHTEIAEIGVSYGIRDLTHSLMRDMVFGGNFNKLLHCDKDGADSVIIEKVKIHKGYVWSLKYKEFLDDGFGGLPRTLKTPENPYTKADCQKVFDKWMSILK